MKCDYNRFENRDSPRFTRLRGKKRAAVEEFFSNSQLAEREDLKSNLAFFLIFLWGPNQGKAFSSRAVNLPFAPLITMTENERCDRLLHKKRTNPVDKSAALFILALSVPSSLKPGTRTHLKVGFIHAKRTRGKDVCGEKTFSKTHFRGYPCAVGHDLCGVHFCLRLC